MTNFEEWERGDFHVDFSLYVVDEEPLSTQAESEIKSRIANGYAASVLVDKNNTPYAVVLQTTEFNLLIGLIELSLKVPSYLKRASDKGRHYLSFAQFKQRLRR